MIQAVVDCFMEFNRASVNGDKVMESLVWLQSFPRSMLDRENGAPDLFFCSIKDAPTVRIRLYRCIYCTFETD